MRTSNANRLDVEEAQTKNSKRCKPFIKWVGGKTQLLGELIERVPKNYKSYFEPFIGGGALFFALQPKIAFLSDINEELINTYKVIKSSPDILIKELGKHKHEEDYFYQIRNSDRSKEFKKWNNIERAARLIYLNKTCFNGLYRVNSKGEFNTPFGSYKNPKIVDRENILNCSLVLKQTQITNRSFLEIKDKATKGDFVYFDPPYVPVSDTAYFTSYSKDGFGPENQIALRDLCKKLDKNGIMFMASNSHTKFVKDLYSDFRIEVIHANRAINSNPKKRGKTEEVIIRNY